jgi:hypothetical protein
MFVIVVSTMVRVDGTRQSETRYVLDVDPSAIVSLFNQKYNCKISLLA